MRSRSVHVRSVIQLLQNGISPVNRWTKMDCLLCLTRVVRFTRKVLIISHIILHVEQRRRLGLNSRRQVPHIATLFLRHGLILASLALFFISCSHDAA